MDVWLCTLRSRSLNGYTPIISINFVYRANLKPSYYHVKANIYARHLPNAVYTKNISINFLYGANLKPNFYQRLKKNCRNDYRHSPYNNIMLNACISMTFRRISCFTLYIRLPPWTYSIATPKIILIKSMINLMTNYQRDQWSKYPWENQMTESRITYC